MGSLLRGRVAERTVSGEVVSMGVKLATHIGATSEKLPPPMVLSWRKTGHSLGKGLPS